MYNRLGMYVRLHGHLKIFQGKRSVNVFSVRFVFLTYFLDQSMIYVVSKFFPIRLSGFENSC